MKFDNLPFGSATVTIEVACNEWKESVRVAEVFVRANDGKGGMSVLIAVKRALQTILGTPISVEQEKAAHGPQ